MQIRLLSTFLLFLILANSSFAQRVTEVNHDYYETFEAYLTTRISLGKKYTSFKMDGPNGIQAIHYKPNTLTSLGINASYKALSLGFGAAFGFLNPNKNERGRTRSFDFQTHIYTRDWVTDLYAQFYKGYYLNQGNVPGTADKLYYIRPDLRINMLGISTYRLLNGDEFSYRASFLQNEWQKQSAGSVLIGAEIHYGNTKGDSALVPSAVASFYPQRDISRVRLFELGPGIGYAYTFVYEEHLFATGSVTFNGDVSFVKEVGLTSATKTSFTPNATLRLVAGYNSADWAATIGWVHNATDAKGASSNLEYSITTGQYSITIARRFMPGSKLKNRLDPVLKLVQ